MCALAGIIRHYSAIGLRLLAADEAALVPYLAGRSVKLDHAIAKMRSDHAEYEEHVRRLVTLCEAIDRDQLGGRGGELAAAINAMAAHLEPHLSLVEREIFSALGGLSQIQRDQIRAAMDARRDRALRTD